MKFTSAISAVLGAATSVAAASDSLPTITAVGSKFFLSNGTQFFLKGVAYQLSDDDPLVDEKQCTRDAALMKTLGANSIRVYHVDASADHSGCMTAFADAGIYALIDLDTFSTYILSPTMTDATWNETQFDRFSAVMDAFSSYDNVLGFFVGNEVIAKADESLAAPYIKAAARDMKAYRDSKGYRKFPIGYSAADIAELRPMLQDYLTCGNASDSVDFYALNSYEWCDPSSYTGSGYSSLESQAKDFPVPIFFSETGCNTPGPRLFADQAAIFGDQMVDDWSGAIVYEWIQEANNYGLVAYGSGDATASGATVVRSGTPTPISPDFNNLKSQWATLTPTGVVSSKYNAASSVSSRACPASTVSGWLVDGDVSLPTVGDSLAVHTSGQSGSAATAKTTSASKTGTATATGTSASASASATKASNANAMGRGVIYTSGATGVHLTIPPTCLSCRHRLWCMERGSADATELYEYEHSSGDGMAARDDEQPLLADEQPSGRSDRTDAERLLGGDDSKSGQHGPGVFVWLLTLSAGISGLLFGYDTGVISATLVSIGSSLSGRPLSSLDKSVITSCTSLAALVASPAASVLADARGRRAVILAADVLFVAGALVQAGSHTVGAMVAGRSVVGVAVGAASFVVPLYIAEVSPAAHRGRLVTINVLFVTLGQVVAYVLGWLLAAFLDVRLAWRCMVGLGAVPAVVQAVLLLASMPESPRWLVRVGRPADARLVIARILAVPPDAPDTVDTLRAIEAEVRQEHEASRLRHHRQLQRRSARLTTTSIPILSRLVARLDGSAWSALFAVRRNRRALAIACLLQGLQQLCGFNSLMYFSATIFSIVGFDQPTLTSLTVAATNFVFTVAALLLVDRIGRRRVLLWSIPVMIAGLLLVAYGFSFLHVSVSGPRPGESDSRAAEHGTGAAYVVLVSIMLYVASYAIGLGNVPWMQSELFALDVRSLGSGLSTATNWLANFAVGLTFLPLMDALSPSWTFVLYAAVCAVGFVLVRACYPETSGLSLEEAAGLLEEDDWGVHR
ncbi:glycoside hydrolase family 72 [Grosmannia clavigera kw1407]|uniref:Glycoside hydrolase family 72 n=1 Tax=Grosmannia clavigera (strain kw1407 / UAMH 11150) TaxID=655863 RepID=F0XTW0_GROCL|nr:glycoside hydrolase family 72 [Grosmannia clavigera kw1407]EFW98931.1 glycoside hydrolase family 72 [Grosmannia clavigera kw1407]